MNQCKLLMRVATILALHALFMGLLGLSPGSFAAADQSSAVGVSLPGIPVLGNQGLGQKGCQPNVGYDLNGPLSKNIDFWGQIDCNVRVEQIGAADLAEAAGPTIAYGNRHSCDRCKHGMSSGSYFPGVPAQEYIVHYHLEMIEHDPNSFWVPTAQCQLNPNDETHIICDFYLAFVVPVAANSDP